MGSGIRVNVYVKGVNVTGGKGKEGKGLRV
jgi:hypothetical protein